MMGSKRLTVLVYGLLGISNVSYANDLDVSGKIESRFRYFEEKPLYAAQGDSRNYNEYSFENRLESKGGGYGDFLFEYSINSYSDDEEEQSQLELMEAYWSKTSGDYGVGVGVNRVFWGVVESNHLVDIVNQTAFQKDFDGMEKIGENMLNASMYTGIGTLDVYLLPGFRERQYPTDEERLVLPGIDLDDQRFGPGASDDYVDQVVRLSGYKDAWDYGLYYFKGISREPILVLDTQLGASVYYYDLIKQLGTDVQYTGDFHTFKLEAIYRQTPRDEFGAYVFGYEYTFYQVLGDNGDVSLLTEYSRDQRNPAIDISPPTIYDDDVFLAVRLRFNNVAGSYVLIGMLKDRERDSEVYNLNYGTRLTNHFSIKLKAKIFRNIEQSDVLSVYQNDSYYNISMEYSFN